MKNKLIRLTESAFHWITRESEIMFANQCKFAAGNEENLPVSVSLFYKKLALIVGFGAKKQLFCCITRNLVWLFCRFFVTLPSVIDKKLWKNCCITLGNISCSRCSRWQRLMAGQWK